MGFATLYLCMHLSSTTIYRVSAEQITHYSFCIPDPGQEQEEQREALGQQQDGENK